MPLTELFEFSGTDVVLIVLFFYMVYKLFFKRQDIDVPAMEVPIVPKLKKQDMTVEQLSRFNGTDEQNICLAICGKIYDVTRGKDFYGPGGVYGALAGHDATRALGTMDITQVKDEYDDHAGMADLDLESASDWQQQMAMKYAFVGRLLAPGEEPMNYDSEKEEKGTD